MTLLPPGLNAPFCPTPAHAEAAKALGEACELNGGLTDLMFARIETLKVWVRHEGEGGSEGGDSAKGIARRSRPFALLLADVASGRFTGQHTAEVEEDKPPFWVSYPTRASSGKEPVAPETLAPCDLGPCNLGPPATLAPETLPP